MKQLLLIIIIGSIVFVNCTSQNEISYEDGYLYISDGHKLYYEKIGSGPEVILIPGGMYYSPIFKQLANADRTLIIYDQRSRGKSSSIKDSSQLGWTKEVDDIESIRQHFDFKTISIIGWSYSGAIATLYAKNFPESTNRLILIGPMPIKRVPYWDVFLQTSQSRRTNDYDYKIQSIKGNFERTGNLERYIKDYYQQSHQLLLFDTSITETFRKDFYTCPNERPDIMWGFTFPTIINSFGDWDFTSELSELALPTLIIHGIYDPVPVESSKEWKTILQNSRLWLINDVGHMPFVEKQKEVLSGINDFLNGTWTDEAIR